jgi:uncharacterized repeat protein (TIGR03847 family)
MPRQVFRFDDPERFVAGTVGQPGDRTFYLQASDRGRVSSVSLEKVQVAALAERVEEMLDELRRRGDDEIPAQAPVELEDVAPLETPILEDFRVGTLALAWDPEARRVVVEAHAQTEGGEPVEALQDDDIEGPDVLRVAVTAERGRAFAKRALRVVAAGRPPCPLCGLPLDPEGHICPRQNGHRH